MTLREQLHSAIGRTDASEGLPHWHTVSDTPDGQPRYSVYVERQAVLDIIDRLTPAGVPQYPDHTHRWQERSQRALDAEYNETGAMLGRWYCPDCFTETFVQPDQFRAGDGASRIAAERRRQIEVEGYDATHDNNHTRPDELALAAASYAIPETYPQRYEGLWPWGAEWFKPTPENRIRELEKAGALIAAEIDRLAALPQPGESTE